MQKLGQHFLKNDAVVKKIINALELDAGDLVVEIGPGHGELTLPLAHACATAGASLAVIEKDTKLAAALREKNPELNIEIECGDALVFLPELIQKISNQKERPKLKLVGNLPYYITGKLLRIISEFAPDIMPDRCIFMVQLEVAERIVAVRPSMNRLAASVQFWADASMIAKVSKGDFSPPPKIDSAVIALHTQKREEGTIGMDKTSSSDHYYAAVRALFAQPRKTLLNNLFAVAENGASKEKISLLLEKLGKNPAARPQDLSIDDIKRIAQELF